ncbi:hypothetical protein Dimus_016845 [Dionaea muscipula]
MIHVIYTVKMICDLNKLYIFGRSCSNQAILLISTVWFKVGLLQMDRYGYDFTVLVTTDERLIILGFTDCGINITAEFTDCDYGWILEMTEIVPFVCALFYAKDMMSSIE